jgi:hypothetical protein
MRDFFDYPMLPWIPACAGRTVSSYLGSGLVLLWWSADHFAAGVVPAAVPSDAEHL